MNMLVLLGHPRPGSFNHALAQVACSALEGLGHRVVFHDLHAEGFDPSLTREELRDRAIPEPLRPHCEELRASEGLVIVHPNWWGQPPAILKGYVDRVFRSGVAYQFQPEDSGAGIPVGLLRIRTAVVLNTTDTDPERERAVMGDPLETLWKNCILGYCGVQTVIRRTYGMVVTSTAGERTAWLEDARRVVEQAFQEQR